ncbi:hypothetical protein LTR78_009154 [Recurvomyces mirabilis]|uniref:Transcription initiation factor TFIID subunit 4 n=1 Tax=Recurvomyces mirabilis TaxID=574656 RepID=A0AAE0TS93_9PEZI|nr:hypothetical protein LTR78_009154 [Recurvomyces mirabilis]KAK5161090.1 hypothetical protein LTS14_000886 [Recurvomyces mirabilis]
MSNYAISPPPQKPAPRPFSPSAYPTPTTAGSPNMASPYGQPPPAKRQRLSPDARSPVGGGLPYMANPYNTYGNPYAQQAPVHSPYGSPASYASPQASFNTPQYHPQWQHSQPVTPAATAAAAAAPTPSRQMSPPQTQSSQSQMMPPPPRPNKDEKEERMNVDDIGDSLFGTGVNVKDEENNLHSTYGSFVSGQGSFTGSSTLSPNNSFNLLTQSTSFGSQNGPNGAFAGTIGRPQSQEEIEAEVKRKKAEATRARNERLQHHMENQFLQTNCIRKRMMERAHEHGVTVNTQGLWQKQPEPRTVSMMNGAGTEGLAAIDTRPEFTATKGDMFEQLMSLVSLAAGERLRGLVDDAYALSRARRYGDHGRVPPDFADIAVGEGEKKEDEVVQESITGTQWDKVPETDLLPNGTTKSATPPPSSRKTLTFQSATAAHLRQLSAADKRAEESRIARRSARRKAASDAAALTNGSADDAAAAGEGSAAEDIAAPKMSKKEIARKEKEEKKQTEKMSATTTNQTAAMMALGKNAKRFSWMSGGAAAGLQNRYKVSPGAAAAAGGAGGSGTVTPGGGGGAGAVLGGGAVVKAEGPGSPAAGTSAGGGGGGGAATAANFSAGSPQVASGADQTAQEVPDWGYWSELLPQNQGIQSRDWMFVLERDGKARLALQRLSTKLA